MRGILAIVVLAGCGDKSGGGEPQSGSWTYVGTGTDADSCGIVPLLGIDSGTFDLVNNGDGTMTIDDGEWLFECTLSGGDFDCPDRFPGGFEDGGIQMDVAGEAHGTFDSDSAGSGGQSGTATCADASCESAAAMMGITPPCEVQAQFSISFDG